MTTPNQWKVAGSYFEVCNCDAICPCRRQGNKPGGRANYDSCDFVLSWFVRQGLADGIGLTGLRVALAGRWNIREVEQPPWQVILYVDDGATPRQRQALTEIFLGRAGGTALANFANAIGMVHSVRSARIELDHTPNRERIRVESFLAAETARAVLSPVPVSCGIPGHDRPGQEVEAGSVRVADPPFDFAFEGRCGFATSFEYRSDG